MNAVSDESCSRCKYEGYLQALAQHSSGEVMSHELVVNEAHHMMPKENPWETLTQQNLSHQHLKPVDTNSSQLTKFVQSLSSAGMLSSLSS